MTTRPDVLLLTGDLVDHGAPDEYKLLRDLLDQVDIPTYLIPGELDAVRLGWLDEQLAAALDAPTLVFMHHPPFATGIW